MQRYPVFVLRFVFAAMISGTFGVSTGMPASLIEWAHVIVGIATIYLIIGLLMRSAVYRELRAPASIALLLALTEAVPGLPRLHAAVSPVLFATLAWAAIAQSAKTATARGLRIFGLPALVGLAIIYGVGYRHAASGVALHIAAAMLAAGVLLCVCMILNQNHPDDATLRGAANITVATVLFQIAAGTTALVIRMLDINGGLALGLARTAHITGAGLVLAASTVLAIRYRRKAIA
ncbi:MAG TPA: hypothetical protein VK789_07190 [Bryobacteraceae bacterium]|jgi:hypothetical protein|nr:hypothetical protein [Bryobacteraceae bacterium]